MNNFLSRLESKKILISDGAMGTMLAAKGLPSSIPSELWNIENPKAVMAVHSDYIASGSDLVSTNTIGANRLKLSKFGLGERVGELAAAGIKIAREAVGDALVAASIGPLGELLEPYGDLTAQDAAEVYSESCGAVAEAGADAILLETFYDISEAEIAIKSASAFGIPVICTMTFDPRGRTMMGVFPEDAVKAIIDAGADVLGANCGVGPDAILPVVEKMCSTSSIPVMVQPNAGMPEMTSNGPVYNETPEKMAEYTEKFLDLGAKIVGACCGSTPAHIAAIAQVVEKRRTKA